MNVPGLLAYLPKVYTNQHLFCTMKAMVSACWGQYYIIYVQKSTLGKLSLWNNGIAEQVNFVQKLKPLLQ